ncbi:MAG: helix-turn-helix domain-containing protein [Bacteroidota bacterium]
MKQIAILVPQHYRLLSIAAILDIFQTVNKFSQKAGQVEPFGIKLIYVPGSGVETAFAAYELRSTDSDFTADLVLIPSFDTDDIGGAVKTNGKLIPWITGQYNAGAEIASVCSGAFLFAATGLLNKKSATTHVDACAAFSAAFPEVQLRPDNTVTEDGRLFTSGGSTSSFHLLLRLVNRYCGKEMAIRVAKVFAIDMDRQSQSYFSTFQPSRNHNDDLVATAQEKIEASYHDTGTIEEMIRDIPSSRRNIVRRFKLVTGITPIEYLQKTRIEAAKKLLLHTGKQMNDIIFNSGYNDPKAFRKIFRKSVGMTPTEYREKFQLR